MTDNKPNLSPESMPWAREVSEAVDSLGVSQAEMLGAINGLRGASDPQTYMRPINRITQEMKRRVALVQRQVFLSGSGIYYPSPITLYVHVQVVGAGGAGGGAATTSASQISSGNGGGAGGFVEAIIPREDFGDSVSIAIGTGGAGSSGSAGGNGGDSTFGSFITANGGTGGGVRGPATVGYAQGGTLGSGGSGSTSGLFDVLVVPGQTGIGAMGFITDGFAQGGNGGSTRFGYGGIGGGVTTGASNGTAGQAGTGYGSGGGGGATSPSDSAVTGGAGADGIIIVTEFLGEY